MVGIDPACTLCMKTMFYVGKDKEGWYSTPCTLEDVAIIVNDNDGEYTIFSDKDRAQAYVSLRNQEGA